MPATDKSNFWARSATLYEQINNDTSLTNSMRSHLWEILHLMDDLMDDLTEVNGDLKSQLSRAQRKAEHGCSDVTCPICDQD